MAFLMHLKKIKGILDLRIVYTAPTNQATDTGCAALGKAITELKSRVPDSHIKVKAVRLCDIEKVAARSTRMMYCPSLFFLFADHLPPKRLAQSHPEVELGRGAQMPTRLNDDWHSLNNDGLESSLNETYDSSEVDSDQGGSRIHHEGPPEEHHIEVRENSFTTSDEEDALDDGEEIIKQVSICVSHERARVFPDFHLLSHPKIKLPDNATIMLEVDEDQYNCEEYPLAEEPCRGRLLETVTAGESLIFIRWNPDAYSTIRQSGGHILTDERRVETLFEQRI